MFLLASFFAYLAVLRGCMVWLIAVAADGGKVGVCHSFLCRQTFLCDISQQR